jgi:hypothetical protein
MICKAVMRMTEQELLNQILNKLETMESGQEQMIARLDKMDGRLEGIEGDIAELKESSQITRHSVNLLLNWAEKSDRIQNIGLYEQAE